MPDATLDQALDTSGRTSSDEDRPSYEQARDELVQIVSRLEAGGIALDESLALWRRGEELATLCEEYLDGARATLDAAVAARDGDESAPSDQDTSGDGPERD